MATVTSYDAAKIEELVSGIEGVYGEQTELRALLVSLLAQSEANAAQIDDLINNVIPNMNAQVGSNTEVVSDLNENQMPNLSDALAENNSALSILTETTMPALEADLASSIINSIEKPYQFFQDEPPESTEDRELMVNDIWYDTNDDNASYRWDGTYWVAFNMPIADLSITVKKFNTATHMIY